MALSLDFPAFLPSIARQKIRGGFGRKLKEAGLDPAAAEAIAEGVGEIDASTLATKTGIAEVKTDISELKAEFFHTLWTTAAGIVGLTVTLIKILP